MGFRNCISSAAIATVYSVARKQNPDDARVHVWPLYSGECRSNKSTVVSRRIYPSTVPSSQPLSVSCQGLPRPPKWKHTIYIHFRPSRGFGISWMCLQYSESSASTIFRSMDSPHFTFLFRNSNVGQACFKFIRKLRLAPSWSSWFHL